ncbi:MAG: hypothetical protein KDD51_09360 [Bdellovibrionales bacterium]|nr:hypothetical protein [Bdellovibrionales bacterium]
MMSAKKILLLLLAVGTASAKPANNWDGQSVFKSAHHTLRVEIRRDGHTHGIVVLKRPESGKSEYYAARFSELTMGDATTVNEATFFSDYQAFYGWYQEKRSSLKLQQCQEYLDVTVTSSHKKAFTDSLCYDVLSKKDKKWLDQWFDGFKAGISRRQRR